jgi:hypothetical protein
VAAALALLVCGSAVDWGHVGGDDPEDVVLVQHNHAAHRLGSTPLSPPQSEHCYLCHSLRLLHVAVTSRHERVAVDAHTTRYADTYVTAVRHEFATSLPSRAPPSSLL